MKRARHMVAIGSFVAAAVAVGTVAVSGTVSASSPTPRLIESLDHPANATCVSNYPERLSDFPIAFDGTIIEQSFDAERAGHAEEDMSPVIVTFQVDNVYAGVVNDTIVMQTWDYYTGTENPSHVGERFLVATGRDRNVVLCGYTRPYSDQDAQYWRFIFGGS